jgi:hypothetical protein
MSPVRIPVSRVFLTSLLCCAVVLGQRSVDDKSKGRNIPVPLGQVYYPQVAISPPGTIEVRVFYITNRVVNGAGRQAEDYSTSATAREISNSV